MSHRRSHAKRPEIKNPWVAWLWDVGERVVRAYAGAWTSIYLVGDKVLDFWSASFQESLIAAAAASFVSAMISLAGKKVGAPDSASILSREKDPPVDEQAVAREKVKETVKRNRRT